MLAASLCASSLLASHAQADQHPTGVCADAYQHPSQQAPQTTLFALGALVCAANSVASPSGAQRLHQVLLDCPRDVAPGGGPGVRSQLAHEVLLWPRDERVAALQFLLAHPMAVTNFNALVLQLVGPPPSFAVIPGGAVAGLSDSWSPADRLALSQLLQMAWSDGHLEAEWRALEPVWRQSQMAPAEIRQVAQRLEEYVHLPHPQPLALAYVTVNPLMPNGSGVTSIFADNHYAIILGPSHTQAEADTLLAHELAHPIVNAFFHTDPRARRALVGASCVYDAVVRDPVGKLGIFGVYTDWEVYFSETLVRGLSHHIMQTPQGADGFILQPTLSWELARYDTAHFSFEELMVRSLVRMQDTYCRRPTDTRAHLDKWRRAL